MSQSSMGASPPVLSRRMKWLSFLHSLYLAQVSTLLNSLLRSAGDYRAPSMPGTGEPVAMVAAVTGTTGMTTA